MPITQQLSTKGNIKKQTNNDLPFQPAQPVISSYYATSTAGQTIINLSFSILTTGQLANTDDFFLFVDGKKLTLGSSNDYTFTAVGSDGTSFQVTLNQSLVAGLNIQAYKLGLKPEVQFGMDNRFAQLYANQNAAFQDWISTTDYTINATNVAGTPVGGTFYSGITNRASIPDLSRDLKPRMAVDRIMTQYILPVPGESAANGGSVWTAANDQFGQIRFTGSWQNTADANGERPGSSGTANNDTAEIVFYGTGLNVLMIVDTATRNFTASIDGGTASANLYPTAAVTLDSRNYGTNQVINVTKGLALGVHTVTLTATGTNNITVYGFEILNESVNVNVNGGIVYSNGQQYTLASQNLFSYSAPVTGVKGGKVAVYESAGVIGTAFTPVNASQLNLASANHTNETMVRQISWREFAAGRTDDMSTVTSATVTKAFGLDDDTTNLLGSGVNTNSSIIAVRDAISASLGGTNFFTFQFVGCGLDVVLVQDSSAARTLAISIDGGSSIGTVTSSGVTGQYVQKIVSGLPYGTHTVQFLNASASLDSWGIAAFNVYHPSVPSIPSGAVLLGDYNVMATYVANATAGARTIGTGTLRKGSTREYIYSGTGWAVNAVTGTFITGVDVGTSTTGDAFTYTFFGTGFDWRFTTGSASATWTVAVDGSTALNGFTTSSYGAGITSFTASTGTLVTSTTSTEGNGISVSGLTLGLHTVKMTKTAGTGTLAVATLDLITPIHSFKNNAAADFQNTLMVGSQGISDDRLFTPVANQSPVKAWAQAVGIGASPTTTATTFVPMPDMSVTLKTSGGNLEIAYAGLFLNATVGQDVVMQVFVDGIAVGMLNAMHESGTNYLLSISDTFIMPVSAGVHQIMLQWFVSAGTGTAFQTYRHLTAREI